MFLQRYAPDSGLRSESGRTLENAILNPWSFDPWHSFGLERHSMPTLIEREDALLVRLELPGVDPADIDVNLTGDELTVAVLGEGKGEVGGKPMHRFASYRRTLRLPAAVNPDAVEAHTENGVLTVELKKPEESMPKRIAVRAAKS